MNSGKYICNELKSLRKSIAHENGIPFKTEECSYQGVCSGTCPRCEAELRYLEQALTERLQLGKVATVAGIALGLAATCNVQAQNNNPTQITDSTVTRIEAPNYDEIIVGKIAYTEHTAPIFPGGQEALDRFIQDNLRYPKEAAENGIGGTVVIHFIVDTDGTITNPVIAKEIGGGCGLEALRLVKSMPRWNPALENGKPVSETFLLPILFDISKNRIPIISGIVPTKNDTIIQRDPRPIKDEKPHVDGYKSQEKKQSTLRGEGGSVSVMESSVRKRNTVPKEEPKPENDLIIKFREDNGTPASQGPSPAGESTYRKSANN